jgi:hypothetical protein
MSLLLLFCHILLLLPLEIKLKYTSYET